MSTEERIERLPRWAQDHIATLQRERDTAVRQLRESEDTQTPTQIFYDYVSAARKPDEWLRKRYIQARGVSFQVGDAEVNIRLRHDTCGLEVQSSSGPIVVHPQASNTLILYPTGTFSADFEASMKALQSRRKGA